MRQNQMFLIIFLLLLGFTFVLSPNSEHQAQEATQKADLYFFEGNTCLPPCWFGLMPDESTSEDVNNYLEQNETLCDINTREDVDDETGLVIDGWYEFRLCPWQRERLSLMQRMRVSYVTVDDNIISQVHILANQDISIHMVLDAMGQPDFIHLDNGVGRTRLLLIYLEEDVIIYLDSQGAGCRFNTFYIYTMDFYSSEIGAELIDVPLYDEQHPRLLAYLGPEERPLPMPLFEEWQANPEMSCLNIWRQLELPEDVPNVLTLTPIVTVTPIPESTKESK